MVGAGRACGGRGGLKVPRSRISGGERAGGLSPATLCSLLSSLREISWMTPPGKRRAVGAL